MQGRIVKGIGGFYYVACADGTVYECHARGVFRKFHQKPLVGDYVRLEAIDEPGKGTITELLPRKNKLFRPEVANIDQAAIVFALREPDISRILLDRFLVSMEKLSVPSLIILTKADLSDENATLALRDVYRACGYPVYPVSIRDGQGIDELRTALNGKVTALAGPSGVGKSSLINVLCPGAHMETGALSEKISRGKNTTRHSELLFAGNDTWISDTPGFGSFMTMTFDEHELELYFPEFDPYLNKCRFTGCAHLKEPDCAVKNAVACGAVDRARYENYTAMYEELASRKKY